MEITGKVLEISNPEQVTEKVTKRELILEYAENPQYPEFLKFEVVNDKCALLDNISVGTNVEVSFNLRGRAWTDKTGKKVYFNSLQLWKIRVLSHTPEYARPADLSAGEDDSSDLPF
jgi:hypothetical protein